MDLQVQIQGKSIILQLAVRIVRDWAHKIKHQYNNSEIKTPLQKYNVLLTDEYIKEKNKNNQRTNFDLIITIEGAQTNPAHIFALSQQLSLFGQNQYPFIPTYLAEVTIANCIAIAVLQHLIASLNQQQFSRTNHNSKETKIHKLSCIECVKYFGVFSYSAKLNGLYENKRGGNVLDGGAPFYSIYQTKKGLLAVGTLQGKFYEEMIDQMGLKPQDRKYLRENQMNYDVWPRMREIFKAKFLQRTAEEWQRIMDSRDTCVTAIKQDSIEKQKYLHPYLIRPKI